MEQNCIDYPSKMLEGKSHVTQGSLKTSPVYIFMRSQTAFQYALKNLNIMGLRSVVASNMLFFLSYLFFQRSEEYIFCASLLETIDQVLSKA